MTELLDARRWASVRAAAIVRLLLRAEGDVRDAEGAVEFGQFDYAAARTRAAVVVAFSVLGVLNGAEIDDSNRMTTFDSFALVDADDLAEGGAIVQLMRAATDRASGELALERMRAFIATIEARIGLDEPLPDLREPDGTIRALAAVRVWFDTAAGLGAPIAGFLPL